MSKFDKSFELPLKAAFIALIAYICFSEYTIEFQFGGDAPAQYADTSTVAPEVPDGLDLNGSMGDGVDVPVKENVPVVEAGYNYFADPPMIAGKYTVYQVVMWHLKAEEGYVSRPQPDGDYRSVGFGYNLNPQNRKMLSGELHDNYVSYREAVELTKKYLKRSLLHLQDAYPNDNPNERAARLLRMYNTGNAAISYSCCGGKGKCGRGLTAHTRRRAFEVQLSRGKVSAKRIEQDRENAAKLDRRNK